MVFGKASAHLISRAFICFPNPVGVRVEVAQIFYLLSLLFVLRFRFVLRRKTVV